MIRKATRLATLVAAIGVPFVLTACGSDSGDSGATDSASQNADAEGLVTENPFDGLYIDKGGDTGVVVDGTTVKMWFDVTGEKDFRETEPSAVSEGSYLDITRFNNGNAKSVTFRDDFDQGVMTIERRDETFFHLAGEDHRVGLMTSTTIDELKAKYEAEEAKRIEAMKKRVNPLDGWYRWKAVSDDAIMGSYATAVTLYSYNTRVTWWDGNVSAENVTQDNPNVHVRSFDFPKVSLDENGDLKAVAFFNTTNQSPHHPLFRLPNGNVASPESPTGAYYKVMVPVSEEESKKFYEIVNHADIDPVREAPIPDMHRPKYYDE